MIEEVEEKGITLEDKELLKANKIKLIDFRNAWNTSHKSKWGVFIQLLRKKNK